MVKLKPNLFAHITLEGIPLSLICVGFWIFLKYPQSRLESNLIYNFLGILLIFIFFASNTFATHFIVNEKGIDNRFRIAFLNITFYRNQIGTVKWEDILFIDYLCNYPLQAGFAIHTNKEVKVNHFLFTPILSNRKKAMEIIAANISKSKFSNAALKKLEQMNIIIS